MTVADMFTTAVSDILDAKSRIQILAATCRGLAQSNSQKLPLDQKPQNNVPQYYHDKEGILKMKTPDPSGHLSDQVVFAIIQCGMGGMCRGQIWTNDFDSNGHIKRDRIPRGPPVISWANGIPFFTVYGGYYIIGGDYLASRSWLLSPLSTPIHPGCLAGLVFASPRAIPADVKLYSQQIHAFQMETWKNIKLQPKTDLERVQKNFTTYTKDHSRLSLIFFDDDSFAFVPIIGVASYHPFLEPAGTMFMPLMQVSVDVGNKKMYPRYYLNERNSEFSSPILRFQLFFDKVKTYSRQTKGQQKQPQPQEQPQGEEEQEQEDQQQEPQQESQWEQQRETPAENIPNTVNQIGQAFTTEYKLGETCLAFDALTNIYNEIIQDRETLNTSPARRIIQLYEAQRDKHAKYRALLQSVQEGIGDKDWVVKLLFRDRIARVSFQDDDQVHINDGRGEAMELDIAGSSDVTLDFTSSPTRASNEGLSLITPILIDGEDD
jgi:hypothetical protein